LTIASLTNDNDIQMRVAISATVEMLEPDNYLACVPKVNLNASGDTADEAIENLMDVIAATYRLYSSLPVAALGPEPSRQWSFLKSHLR